MLSSDQRDISARDPASKEDSILSAQDAALALNFRFQGFSAGDEPLIDTSGVRNISTDVSVGVTNGTSNARGTENTSEVDNNVIAGDSPSFERLSHHRREYDRSKPVNGIHRRHKRHIQW